MYFRSNPDEKTRLSHMGQIGYYNQVNGLELQKKILQPYVEELVNKKGVFLPGGVGRLTNYARSLGIDAHCLDHSAICEGLCKKYYPDVPFIKADMSYEKEGFDFAFFEDLLWRGFSESHLKVVVNWQKVCRIYPTEINYKVIRFNSTVYEQNFSAPEEDLQKYFDIQLKNGVIDAFFNLEDLDDYEIEEYSFQTNNHISDIFHEKDPRFKFLGIGTEDVGNWRKVNFNVRLYCEGYKLNLQTNSRHLIPNVPQEKKSFPF